ncbi:MAG: c-type cytochrome [Xanthobacteraceae bacterium]|nr:c-type cytochrome [Xanthobacteraceae bacterium]
MKRIALTLAALTVLLAAAPAHAGDAMSASIRNCTWCHGTSAQGYTVAPRLAGQQARYLETQLYGFATHRRDNPASKQYMWNATAALKDSTIRDLADYFAALPPRPANDGHRDLAGRGQAIYSQGIPEANVAACLACHGPNAQGIRDIPRLGGLSYSYLKQRLEQWNQGYHGAVPSPMPVVARSLSADEVEALASYLSFVR